MTSERNQVAVCERVLELPQYVTVQELDWLFVAHGSQEAQDVASWSQAITASKNFMQEYDSVVFMYACFNLLYLGDDNF